MTIEEIFTQEATEGTIGILYGEEIINATLEDGKVVTSNGLELTLEGDMWASGSNLIPLSSQPTVAGAVTLLLDASLP